MTPAIQHQGKFYPIKGVFGLNLWLLLPKRMISLHARQLQALRFSAHTNRPLRSPADRLCRVQSLGRGQERIYRRTGGGRLGGAGQVAELHEMDFCGIRKTQAVDAQESRTSVGTLDFALKPGKSPICSIMWFLRPCVERLQAKRRTSPGTPQAKRRICVDGRPGSPRCDGAST